MSALACWPFGLGQAQERAKLTKLLVGFPPGGPIDGIARVLQAPLQEAMGTRVIVDYHSGASGRIAVAMATRALATGQTLLITPSAQVTIQPHLLVDPPIDPIRQLAPIALLATTALCVVVASDHPARNVGELKEWFARNPALANCGTPGSGSVAHLVALALSRQMDVGITPVHYRGAAEMLAALLEGSLHSAVAVPFAALPLAQAGRVRILVTTSDARADSLPTVPTMRESNLDVVASEWAGAFAPKGMGAEQLDALNRAFCTSIAQPGVQSTFARYGLTAGAADRAQFTALVNDDHERWGRILKDSGVSVAT
ncbi:tripartite tricarboxylate transporter substrate binding protein [Variovorax sp. J22R133]|uniref:Bug family tripartite tricarboxylate transporter substrate binding protein n=1 Tax=Variovorax brevis TaxID=3053503 RepID=UPI002577F8B1|nr:tripartite tricarboxylate transporter substrate binding protein [Variovorax sp. J22R133]MDM0112277.1 tripartite tricarboxylate transporter substrate binding protein [Variovorax sp. J22R133]